MSKTVCFLDMFSQYNPGEEELNIWQQVLIHGAQLNQQERRIALKLYSPT